MLKDLHNHLYGSLTAEHLFQIGRDRYRTQADRMRWFESEYKLASGETIQSDHFWTKENGFELLKSTFEATRAMPFALFQAKFNLAIALCPVNPDDMTVLRTVMKQHAEEGISYCEYRTFLPPTMTHSMLDEYLTALISEMQKLNAELSPFHARLALTLQRDVGILDGQLKFLDQWLDKNPSIQDLICGIDFAGYEETCDLSELLPFAQEKMKSSKTLSSKSIFLHVGETCEATHPDLVLEKIHFASMSKVARLGHASVAGLSHLDALKGKSFKISKSLFTRHQNWISQNCPEIKYPKWSDDLIALPFDADRFRKIQNFVLNSLSQNKQIIESCPSSNLILGHFEKPEHLPFVKFFEKKVPFVICSDDPGIFATHLERETQLAEQILALPFPLT